MLMKKSRTDEPQPLSRFDFFIAMGPLCHDQNCAPIPPRLHIVIVIILIVPIGLVASVRPVVSVRKWY
jgi:hypothetical protein